MFGHCVCVCVCVLHARDRYIYIYLITKRGHDMDDRGNVSVRQCTQCGQEESISVKVVPWPQRDPQATMWCHGCLHKKLIARAHATQKRELQDKISRRASRRRDGPAHTRTR